MPSPRKLGKYEVLEELGQDGFAAVYKALYPSLNRVVALKVLYLYWSGEPGVAARLKHEAQTAAKLYHPNIVSVYEAGQIEGQLCFALVYLVGRTISGLLAAGGAQSLERALPPLAQMAGALDYAHKRGVVYRDVKPANIIPEKSGQKVYATLLDFGLVKVRRLSVGEKKPPRRRGVHGVSI